MGDRERGCERPHVTQLTGGHKQGKSGNKPNS
jgi:hypothetical protein